MNVTEDYVSYEVAKLLKEKGFDEQCRDFYRQENGNWLHRNTYEYNYFNLQMPRWEDCYSCPTHQMAMKWLREAHKISIEITSTGYLIDGDATWGCDIKAGHRLYYQHITNEKSYESCVEAALKYSLENLI